MGPQLYIQERLSAERRQELVHEMELTRLVAHSHHQSSLGRRVIGKMGTFLVTVGTKLERFEQQEHTVVPAQQ